MQLHLSWVVLVPYVLLAIYFQIRRRGVAAIASVGWFTAGALLPLTLLVPTFMKYGLMAGLGNTNDAVGFNSGNLLRDLNIVEGVLGRFLSFASFELPRFLGKDTASRLAFLRAAPWLVPFAVFLTLLGIAQALALLVLWFKRRHSQNDWKGIKYFTLATVALLYLLFLFSVKQPASHTFYVTFPVAFLYSLYCWNELLLVRRWRRFALACVIAGVIFEVGLSVYNLNRVSIFTERARIVQALKERDYRIYGERRPGTKY